MEFIEEYQELNAATNDQQFKLQKLMDQFEDLAEHDRQLTIDRFEDADHTLGLCSLHKQKLETHIANKISIIQRIESNTNRHIHKITL
jgi:hypothetical protein